MLVLYYDLTRHKDMFKSNCTLLNTINSYPDVIKTALAVLEYIIIIEISVNTLTDVNRARKNDNHL